MRECFPWDTCSRAIIMKFFHVCDREGRLDILCTVEITYTQVAYSRASVAAFTSESKAAVPRCHRFQAQRSCTIGLDRGS
jgi:hypothetical protein